MATYNAPIVPVFNAGAAPTETGLDTRWYQVASFFQNGIVFRANQSTTPTTLPTSGSAVTIAYDTVLEDPYSGWNASTHQWGPPAGYSGWYHVTATVRIINNGALVDLRPSLQGTYVYTLSLVQTANISSSTAGASGTSRVYLIGGQDTIGVAAEILNASGAGTTATTSGQNSTLEIVYISQS